MTVGRDGVGYVHYLEANLTDKGRDESCKGRFVVFDYLLYALMRNYLQEGGLTEFLKARGTL